MSELDWQRVTAEAAPLELPERRTVVVVPHPDDETLLSGGLIARQSRRGVPVTIVAVTDGEAAYPTWPSPGLARVRRNEQARALHMLDVPAGSIVRLHLPDGNVAGHESELADVLIELSRSDDLIVAPWIHDWHPDHEACGRAARVAIDARHATLLGSLFWAYHHVDPHAHPGLRVAKLHLTEPEANRRANALNAHRSQIQSQRHDPILDPRLTEHLDRNTEHFVVAS